MADRFDRCVRGFVIRSEAWYARHLPPSRELDEIHLGMYHEGGGSPGEFSICWIEVGKRPTPRLEVFNDAWRALAEFGDVLAWMAEVDGQRVDPKTFAAKLRELGLQDLTERTKPSNEPGDLEFASWLVQLRRYDKGNRPA